MSFKTPVTSFYTPVRFSNNIVVVRLHGLDFAFSLVKPYGFREMICKPHPFRLLLRMLTINFGRADYSSPHFEASASVYATTGGSPVAYPGGGGGGGGGVLRVLEHPPKAQECN